MIKIIHLVTCFSLEGMYVFSQSGISIYAWQAVHNCTAHRWGTYHIHMGDLYIPEEKSKSRARIRKGTQESIPRNRFRQPLKFGGPIREKGCRTTPPDWESIPGLFKRFTNTGSGLSLVHLSRCLCRFFFVFEHTICENSRKQRNVINRSDLFSF
jgi:hypothetical protein